MSGKLGSKHGVIRTITLKCIGCGKSYETLGKHRRNGAHPSLYCSPQCYHKNKYEHSIRGRLLTAARLRKLINYDPKTGIFTWLIWRGKTPAGSIAGTIMSKGYRVICIDYKHYIASHLAHLWMTGRLPKSEMDHRNCNPADNRWSNLRPATSRQNKANMRIRENKNTPFKGVSFHKHSLKYRAYITIDGHHASLGYFDNPKAAHAAYMKAARKYFGKFARAK